MLLYEEYRLVERSESDVSGVWKGAHLLLFFLAFVFGSFCTFCFHMIMYMFDDKCVLFPRLMSLTTPKHAVVYEFIPAEDGDEENHINFLPVDFLSTQWMDKSSCYLPTYVPLVSGIFGLVWTSMFLMCNSSGLQRPWWVLPFSFFFSLAMGGLCIYSSSVTHHGLNELCQKLGAVTGSYACSYTVNVATLAYEKRIRGVYQATRLTVLSAWLHTLCWLLSAALTIARIILVVDFQLVKVTVQLKGDVDKLLELHEQQIRAITLKGAPGLMRNVGTASRDSSVKVYYKNKSFDTPQSTPHPPTQMEMDLPSTFKIVSRTKSESHFLNTARLSKHKRVSRLSLVPDERFKLVRRQKAREVAMTKRFIVGIVNDLLRVLPIFDGGGSLQSSSTETQKSNVTSFGIKRQYGESNVVTAHSKVEEENVKRLTETVSTQISVLEGKLSLEQKSMDSLMGDSVSNEIELAKVALGSNASVSIYNSSTHDTSPSLTSMAVQGDKRKKIIFIEPVSENTEGPSTRQGQRSSIHRKKKEKMD